MTVALSMVDAPPFAPEPLHNELHVPPSRRHNDSGENIVLPIDGDGNTDDSVGRQSSLIVIDLC